VSDPSTSFGGLRALFIDCTLTRSPAVSTTQGLIDISARIMEINRGAVEVVRAIDHDIATGVWSDMRDGGPGMLRLEGGIPVHGNVRSGWDAGCRYDFANPEYC